MDLFDDAKQDSTEHMFVCLEVESSVDIVQHDLLQFESSVDIGTVGFEGVESFVMGVVGTAGVVEGPADSTHNFLDMVLCEHASPRDQNFVGGSDGRRPAAATTAATADSNRKRQHQP